MRAVTKNGKTLTGSKNRAMCGAFLVGRRNIRLFHTILDGLEAARMSFLFLKDLRDLLCSLMVTMGMMLR